MGERPYTTEPLEADVGAGHGEVPVKDTVGAQAEGCAEGTGQGQGTPQG